MKFKYHKKNVYVGRPINIQEELTRLMAEQIAEDIDRQILDSLRED